MFGDDELRVKQLRTHVKSDITDQPLDIGNVSYSRSHRSNRFVIDDAFFMKRRSDVQSSAYHLDKYNKDGSSQRIVYPSSSDTDVLSDVPMVSLGGMLYVGKKYGLTLFNPKLEAYSSIDLDKNLTIYEMAAVGTSLYFLAMNHDEDKFQIVSYDTITKDAAKNIHTFELSSLPFYTAMHVNGSKILLKFTTFNTSSEEHMLYGIDTVSNAVSFLPNTGRYIDRARNHRNLIYYGAEDINVNVFLWQSDGTPTGTKKVLDTEGNTIKSVNLTIINDKVYFSNSTDEHGEELWVIDDDGAHMLIDVVSGEDSSSPRYMSKLNDGIVFQATKDASNHLYYYHDDKLEMLN